MAEGVDLDLSETARMIQRFSQLVDAAWQKARRTGAPGALVLALDEASLGLHRARIALNGSLFETAIPMTLALPVPSEVDRESAVRRTGAGYGHLADVTTGQPTLAIGRCEHAADH